MTTTKRLAAASSVLALSLLAGCVSNPVAGPDRLPTMKTATDATALRFASDAGSAGLVRVRVPGGSMRVGSTHVGISPSLRSREVRLMVPEDATLADVVGAIQAMDITVAFKWRNGDKTDILEKKPPFTRFNGTFGSMLDALRRGAGVVSWQEGGTVFLSDADRFSITLPQDKDIIEDTSKSLTSLGATDVVTSVEAGTIVYSATPDLQSDVLAPFLDKLLRNLSTVNLQVAIVSLAVNDKVKQGFDWNAFAVKFGDEATNGKDFNKGKTSTISNSTGTVSDGTSIGNGGTATGTGAGTDADTTSDALNNAVKALSTGVSIGTTTTGDVFGRAIVTSVSAAIDFLSTFGNTNVSQHVDLRTISGKEVKFHSGQEIPYVKGISSTTTSGTYSTTGATDTDTVETGLTVEMTPRYDSHTNVVTVDFNLELKSVIEFIQLNAGKDIGTLTQPRTQSQELSDLVRLRAGQTVVLGGLQYDQEQYNGTEPAFMRKALRDRQLSLGSRTNDVSRQALFVIMRPVVTVYEPDGGYGVGSSPFSEAMLK